VKRFSDLYQRIDATNRTSEKIWALADYFSSAPPEDAAWAVMLLTGDRPKRVVDIRDLVRVVLEDAHLPMWMLEECYDAVGDLAETAALVLPEGGREKEPPSLSFILEQTLLPMRSKDSVQIAQDLREAWRDLDTNERLVFFKLIGGAFRVGASRGLVLRALAKVAGVPVPAIASRLSGTFHPTAESFRALVDPDEKASKDDPSRPYPFFLATPHDGAPAELGPREDFIAEWKWDGIRAQLVRRNGATWVWSRGEEIVTGSFPEIATAAERLPDGTVLDGEILAWRDGVLPFANLQRRLGRKIPTRKSIEMVPVVLLVYDLLEDGGADVRDRPIEARRERLEAIASAAGFPISPIVDAPSWEELETLWNGSRERRVEGLMLKRRGSPYRTGRPRGDWWKWKIAPLSIDCVLVYAQRGSGRRASLYSDYTFAVRDGNELVPFAKAYSGLSDDEMKEVDAFVRRHTIERFGPVRHVEPKIVVELGFEGIQRSSRHKSGIAVRFPRILRLRPDKTPDQADTLESLRALADAHAPEPPVEPKRMQQLDLFNEKK
jgi:DNA ligase-1